MMPVSNVPPTATKHGRRVVPRTVVLRAASTAWVYRIVNAACGLIVLPLTVSHLTPLEFGIWVTVGQALSFLTVADLGSANAVGRLLARQRGLDDRHGVDRVLSTTFAVSVVAGFVTIAVVALLAFEVPRWGGLSGDISHDAFLVTWIAGLSLSCQIVLRAGLGILTGHQLYGMHGVGKVLESVLTLGIVSTLSFRGALTLISLAIGTAASILVAQSVQMLLAWRLTGPWKLSLRFVTRKSIREVTGLGGSMLVGSLGGLVHNQGIGLIVSRIAGFSAGGLFGAALMVVANLHPLITSFTGPLSTLASEMQARNALGKLQETSLVVMRLTAGLAAIAVAGAFAFADIGLRTLIAPATWSAADIRTVAITLIVMCSGVFIGAPVVSLRLVLQGTGHHWLVAATVTTAALAGGAVAVLALSAGIGLASAAMAWSVVLAVQTAAFAYMARSRGQGPAASVLLLSVYLPAIAIGVLSYALDLGVLAMAGTTAARVPLLVTMAIAGVLGLGILLVTLRPSLRGPVAS